MEASQPLEGMMIEIEMAYNTRVKCIKTRQLLTDIGGEFASRKFSRCLNVRGTIDEFSAFYSHESNR